MKRISLFVAVVLSVVSAFPQSGMIEERHYSHGTAYALVAGGSKGIGYAIAEALAKRGYNLILIARHMDSLISAKDKLECDYGIHVEILAYDLSQTEAATDIAKWCMERNIPLKMLRSEERRVG